MIEYKKHLQENYAVRNVNSMLASINGLFVFLCWHELKVKSIKLQQKIYCPEEKELTKAEYTRLCRAAEKRHNERLNLILQTICGTGIRVSELQYITVEAVKQCEATVSPQKVFPLQGENAVCVYCERIAKEIAPLRSRAKDYFRCYIYNSERQTNEPNQHLA